MKKSSKLGLVVLGTTAITFAGKKLKEKGVFSKLKEKFTKGKKETMLYIQPEKESELKEEVEEESELKVEDTTV